MGTLFAHVILVVLARGQSLADAAALRRGIYFLSEWAMYPCVLVVVFSGLIATLVNRQFRNAFWVWIKVGLGLPVAEVCLGPIRNAARDAAALAAQAAAGHRPDPQDLYDVLHREWAGLWMVIVLAVINVALAIWRPRLVSPREGID